MGKLIVTFGWAFEVDGKDLLSTFKTAVWDSGEVEFLLATWDDTGKYVPGKLVEADFDELVKAAREVAAEKGRALEDAYWDRKLLAMKEGEL